jgi:hypothetical protein
MQDCPDCRATVSEAERTCPSCGSELPGGPDGLGDYRFEDLIYEGEHTTTYRARHRANDEPVAVVRFLESLSPDQVSRLKEDAERVRSIRGPRVIRVHGFHVTDQGEAYRVKELVDGEPLPALVRRGYFKSIRNAVWLMTELTRAVEDIHAAGLLAPYTLPDDVLVSRPEHVGKRAVRVGYHGYRFLDPVKDRPGPSLRRLLEDHPDLKGETRISRLSDIHTLGRLFYEVVAGDRPGPDPDLDPALRLPVPLEALIRSMLDPDPSRRPRSTGEVLAQLEKARRVGCPPEAGKAEDTPPRLKIGRLVPLLVSVIALVAALAVWLGPSQDDGRRPTAMEEAGRAVVFIRTFYKVMEDRIGEQEYEESGTGFLVDDRTVVTARHVAAPWVDKYRNWNRKELKRIASFEAQIFIWPPGVKPFKVNGAGKRDWDLTTAWKPFKKSRSVPLVLVPGDGAGLEYDLAVLRLEESVKIKPVELLPDDEFYALKRGDNLHFLSYPGGSESFEKANRVDPVYDNGTIALKKPRAASLRVNVTNFEGSSGGALLDSNGRVVGIALQSVQYEHDVTIFLGVPDIRRLFRQVENGIAAEAWRPGAGPRH